MGHPRAFNAPDSRVFPRTFDSADRRKFVATSSRSRYDVVVPISQVVLVESSS